MITSTVLLEDPPLDLAVGSRMITSTVWIGDQKLLEDLNLTVWQPYKGTHHILL